MSDSLVSDGLVSDGLVNDTLVNDTEDRIREVLDTHARLTRPASVLDAGDDLYAAGMTSHASVNVMLALEDAFDIEFPDDLLNKATFCTLERLRQAVSSLQGVHA